SGHIIFHVGQESISQQSFNNLNVTCLGNALPTRNDAVQDWIASFRTYVDIRPEFNKRLNHCGVVHCSQSKRGCTTSIGLVDGSTMRNQFSQRVSLSRYSSTMQCRSLSRFVGSGMHA